MIDFQIAEWELAWQKEMGIKDLNMQHCNVFSGVIISFNFPQFLKQKRVFWKKFPGHMYTWKVLCSTCTLYEAVREKNSHPGTFFVKDFSAMNELRGYRSPSIILALLSFSLQA